MQAETFFESKIKRLIRWNGRDFTFTRYKKDIYHEMTDEIDKQFSFKGFFHQAGGYGGMLNIEIYERDGSRTATKLKPMIICMFDDGKDLMMDDIVYIGSERFKLIDKSNIQNYGVAFELSLDKVNEV